MEEQERIDAIVTRWNAIPDIRGAFIKAEVDICNPMVELNRIIDENDITTLELYEQTSAEWQAEVLVNADIEISEKLGEIVDKGCNRAFRIIIGWNLRHGLSRTQVDLMEANFAESLKAIQNRRPDKAYILVSGVTVDGVLVTHPMKNQVMEILQGVLVAVQGSLQG